MQRTKIMMARQLVLHLSALFVLLSLLTGDVAVTAIMSEADRLKAREERNYTWPIEKYVPNTPGWAKLLNDRFAQIAEMDGSSVRYDGYRHLMPAALVTPNFTEWGFGLARAPPQLVEELQRAVREGLPNARQEKKLDVIGGGEVPLFVDRKDLTDKVMGVMHPYAEEWVNVARGGGGGGGSDVGNNNDKPVKLVPMASYGFRIYREGNQLMMHADKADTHVVSFILHVDSSPGDDDDPGAEPWPIFIEDFHGRTHEVVLTPGDVLFYESSKCLHGRPKPLRRKWYTSVFVHYRPADWSDGDETTTKTTTTSSSRGMDAHYAVPPHWRDEPPARKQHEPLEMSGMSFREPNCEHGWCRASDGSAIKWNGPGEENFLINPDGIKVPYHPLQIADDVEEDVDDDDVDDADGDSADVLTDEKDDEDEYDSEEDDDYFDDSDDLDDSDDVEEDFDYDSDDDDDDYYSDDIDEEEEEEGNVDGGKDGGEKDKYDDSKNPYGHIPGDMIITDDEVFSDDDGVVGVGDEL